jgi:hypothetical protein
MKAQIAIIVGGVAIAAAVTYAELKPSNTVAEQTQQSSTPTPIQSSAVPQSTPQKSQSVPAPSSKLTNPNSRIQMAPPNGDSEGHVDRNGDSHGDDGGRFNGGGDD